ncbi:adaptin ear-binding coat-associated protein 1 [Stemphylium lycopersici]|nr:adaptin ear-binding coat-associated protein 1 [Stemphylium lycopersici]
MNVDPLTGTPLPSTAIQRILYLAPKVHIYQIPPAITTKGYQASTWTANNNQLQIFTARLRVVETSIPNTSDEAGNDGEEEKVTTTLLLEDPKNGDLFAAAPYTSERTVEQALDSSRFFAITVVGEGRKAVLGMGFEERSEAFDFSIALQDARRVLGLDQKSNSASSSSSSRSSRSAQNGVAEEPKRDFSLKAGETISINLGGLKGRRSRSHEGEKSDEGQKSEQDALFSIKPPPGSGGAGGGFLPPPPSAKSVKEERRRSRQNFDPASLQPKQTAEDLGFDDGEFGEFQ